VEFDEVRQMKTDAALAYLVGGRAAGLTRGRPYRLVQPSTLD
jgi:hypothetical protein